MSCHEEKNLSIKKNYKEENYERTTNEMKFSELFIFSH